MVPEALAGAGSRGARIPPHDAHATRRARGLEAALVDYDLMEITAIDPMDRRRCEVKVAGAAALLVAKLHKIGERVSSPTRLNDKDAHDIFRILRAVETDALQHTFCELLHTEMSQAATTEGLKYLARLFSTGPDALGSLMAGRAEETVGDPQYVSTAVSLLAADLLAAIEQ